MKQKSITDLFALRLPLLLTLLSLSTLVGCREDNVFIPREAPGKLSPIGLPGNKKIVLALVHGANSFESTGITDLGQRFPQDVKDAEVIILNRYKTDNLLTTQQAEDIYEELKSQMQQKNVANLPVCLIGHSRGGLVALEIYRKHKDDLNIKGMVVDHCPLEGAPGLHASKEVLSAFKHALIKIFVHSKNPSLMTVAPILKLLNIEHVLAKNIEPTMKQDLTEGSPLLNNVQSTLSNIDIPVLIVAGKVDIKLGIVALVNFIFKRHEVLKNIPSQLASALDKLSPADLANLESTFSTVIGDKDNDCLLPYYSQIGGHLPKSSKVISKNYMGHHHFYGISKEPRVYNDLLEFIKL